ncbi:unnamed protein product, partial [Prorocentrum cordatum]
PSPPTPSHKSPRIVTVLAKPFQEGGPARPLLGRRSPPASGVASSAAAAKAKAAAREIEAKSESVQDQLAAIVAAAKARAAKSSGEPLAAPQQPKELPMLLS